MSTQIAPNRAEVAAEARPVVELNPFPTHWRSLGRMFVHHARAKAKSPAMSDSSGTTLSYGDAFLRSIALGRVLAREVGDEKYVGVMVPPSVPGAVTNLALTLLGKIPVNLNYSASQNVIDAAVEQCKIGHVVTSKKLLEKLKLNPKGKVLLLEDLAKKVSKMDKVVAAATAKLVPKGLLPLSLPGLRNFDPETTATVIFTSGSTGDPKGVVLSHRNVMSNIWQFKQVVPLRDEEVVLGILPFFHSFGFTVTIWTVLGLGFHGVYHVDPTDARIIGKLSEEKKATILFASPTFMRGLAKRCGKEQFAAMRMTIVGAEKLKPELAQLIRDNLGVEPLEGYGCTETGPVVAVNIPGEYADVAGPKVIGNKPGTVGRLLPGTSARTVDPETGADLPRGEVGLVHVRGPQVMMGYLDRPDATAKVLQNGWYNTGDLGKLDDDGFLTITDRVSRFSKIGGEMVPHMGVESALLEASGAPEGSLAVTSLPDAKRGERLVVIHTALDLAPAEILRRMADGHVPRLWVPGIEDFVLVDSLPVSGTKLDLRGLRELAKQHLGA